MKIAILVVSVFLVFPAFGQGHKNKVKRTQVEFGNQEIRGQKDRPEVLLTNTRTKQVFKKLIRLRPDFRDKMKDTASNIKSN